MSFDNFTQAPETGSYLARSNFLGAFSAMKRRVELLSAAGFTSWHPNDLLLRLVHLSGESFPTYELGISGLLMTANRT